MNIGMRLPQSHSLGRPEGGATRPVRNRGLLVALAMSLSIVIALLASVAQAPPARAAEQDCRGVDQRDKQWRSIDSPLPPVPWTPVGGGGVLDDESQYMANVEVDPSDPSHLMVAGSLDVMQSHDAGCTWSPSFSMDLIAEGPMKRCSEAETLGSPTTPACGHIASLTIAKNGYVYLDVRVDPYVCPFLCAGASHSLLYGNAKGGAPDAWEPITSLGSTPSNPEYSAFAAGTVRVAPSDPNTLYTTRTMGNLTPSALFASKDGGKTWTRRDTPPEWVWAPYAQFISPLDPDELYMTAEPLGTQSVGLYRSTDGGSKWERMDVPEGLSLMALGASKNGDLIMAGMIKDTVVLSRDRGDNWTSTVVVPISPKGMVFGKDAQTLFIAGHHESGDMILRMELKRKIASFVRVLPWGTYEHAYDLDLTYVPGAGFYFLSDCWPSCLYIGNYTGRGT